MTAKRERESPALIRSSNLELLRIISMILIILHHISVHGGFNIAGQAFSFNTVFIQLISFGGKLGVCCFILITGYFMITSQFKIKKLLKLILEVLFYSIGIMLIFYGFGITDFSLVTFVKSLLPITHSLYWFVTVYVVLYVLSPFLNHFLKNCSQKMHLVLIGILFVLGSLIPTFTLGNLYVNELGLFILFYITAAYIRLYPDACLSWFTKTKENLFVFFSMFILIAISVIVFDILGTYFDIIARNATYFMSIKSPFIILGSVCLFLWCKNLKIPNSRFINQIALSMFGVYLIHDNMFVRPWLWNDVFHTASYFHSPYLVLVVFGILAVVFVGCVVIDQIRIQFLEKPVFMLVDKMEAKHKDRIDNIRGKVGVLVQKYLL